MRKRVIIGAAAVAAAAAMAGRAVLASRRAAAPSVDPDQPVDLGFMLSMHAALRRDVTRLQRTVGTGRPASDGVLAGWDLFRRELLFHHQAEDEDLWPRLASRLSKPEDRAVVDAMYAEHAGIPAVLESFDAALHAGTQPNAGDMAIPLLEHLDHEERDALPLVATHLSDAEWHDFLMTERRKRPPRERAEFLMWVLDDADPDVAEPVLRELPAPGRFVYHNVLRRLYERRKLWADDEEGASTRHGATPPRLARAG
jgi:hypothetical protein